METRIENDMTLKEFVEVFRDMPFFDGFKRIIQTDELFRVEW